MSLILDALRKMEQERKSRLGGSVDIRPEVLRYRGAAPQPPARRAYLQGAVALVLIAAGVGTGLFLKGGGGSETPAEVVAAREARPVPLPEPVIPPAPAPEEVAPQAAAVPSPATFAPQPPAAPATPLPRPVAAPYSPPVPVSSSAAAKPHRGVEAPQEGSLSGDEVQGGDLTVSGIAWQEERALRRAVVNGVLVGEGAEVAGARVVEIRESRVRFSRGGHSFDISYSAPGH